MEEEIKEAVHEHHVLMVSLAVPSHIHPLLSLGKRLLSKGLHVSLALPEAARHRMNVDCSTESDIRLLFFSDSVDSNYGSEFDVDEYMKGLAEVGPCSLAKLIKDNYYGDSKKKKKKLSCIINNSFIPWVADVAAELGNIPCALLWIQPCSLFSIYYRFYNKTNPFPCLQNPSSCVELPGLPILRTRDLPSFVLPSYKLSSVTKIFSDLFVDVEKKHCYKWVFVNSFFELEQEAAESMSSFCSLRPVGPLVPPSLLGQGESETLDARFDLWKSEDSCLQWLDEQANSTVVYISFGSLHDWLPNQTDAIAAALKNLKLPFLWVVKQSTNAVEVECVERKLPLGFLEETKDQGIVVMWCRQAEVLTHPALACFVTHCGWSSLLETIVTGVPVVACPQWSDQPTNAKLVADVFKIGVRLSTDEDGFVGSEKLEKCVDEAINGPRSEEFRRNARKLQRAARKATTDGGSSERNIQLFFDEILGN